MQIDTFSLQEQEPEINYKQLKACFLQEKFVPIAHWAFWVRIITQEKKYWTKQGPILHLYSYNNYLASFPKVLDEELISFLLFWL